MRAAARHGARIELDFPAVPATEVTPTADLLDSLDGTVPVWTGITSNDDPGERNILAVPRSSCATSRPTGKTFSARPCRPSRLLPAAEP